MHHGSQDSQAVYSLADLFSWTPSRLLWEVLSQATINAQRLHVLCSSNSKDFLCATVLKKSSSVAWQDRRVLVIAAWRVFAGIPLVYELDKDLRPVTHYYLATEAEIKAAMDKVAAQGKAAKWDSLDTSTCASRTLRKNSMLTAHISQHWYVWFHAV